MQILNLLVIPALFVLCSIPAAAAPGIVVDAALAQVRDSFDSDVDGLRQAAQIEINNI